MFYVIFMAITKNTYKRYTREHEKKMKACYYKKKKTMKETSRKTSKEVRGTKTTK